MNARFPVLSTLSLVLRFVGWAIVVISGAYAIYQGIVEPNLPRHGFGQEDLLQFLGGAAGMLQGLIIVALAELIGVLFAIEENTRRAAPDAGAAVKPPRTVRTIEYR